MVIASRNLSKSVEKKKLKALFIIKIEIKFTNFKGWGRNKNALLSFYG